MATIENLKCASIKYRKEQGDTFNFNQFPQFPVPALTIEQQYRRINEGKIENYQITFNLEGKIYNDDLSTALEPAPVNQAFNTMTSYAEQLREAFAEDGYLSIIGSNNQTDAVIKNTYAVAPHTEDEFPCKLQSINFSPTPDNWTQSIDYTISLLADVPGPCGSGVIESMSNTWTLAPYTEYPYLKPMIPGAEDVANIKTTPGYKITHNITAAGRYVPTPGLDPCDGDAVAKIRIDNAVKWMIEHFNDGAPTFLSGSEVHNFTRQINYNTADGNYSITDEFEWTDGFHGSKSGFLDSYSLETTYEAETDLRTVVVQGNIIGLESLTFSFDDVGPAKPYGWTGYPPSNSVRLEDIEFKDIDANNVASGRFTNAMSGWKIIEPKLFTRAQYATGVFTPPTGCDISTIGSNKQRLGYLNPIVQSTSVGLNVKEGSISYSYTYNNDPKPITPCALDESFDVSDTLPSRQTAEIFIIGRRLGPVLQDLGTYTSPTRTVNYNVTIPKASSISGVVFPSHIYDNITGVLSQFDPEYLLPSPGTQPGTVKSFLKTNTDSWNPIEGKFTKNMVWTYTVCDGTLDDLTNPNIQS